MNLRGVIKNNHNYMDIVTGVLQNGWKVIRGVERLRLSLCL